MAACLLHNMYNLDLTVTVYKSDPPGSLTVEYVIEYVCISQIFICECYETFTGEEL